MDNQQSFAVNWYCTYLGFSRFLKLKIITVKLLIHWKCSKFVQNSRSSIQDYITVHCVLSIEVEQEISEHREQSRILLLIYFIERLCGPSRPALNHGLLIKGRENKAATIELSSQCQADFPWLIYLEICSKMKANNLYHCFTLE